MSGTTRRRFVTATGLAGIAAMLPSNFAHAESEPAPELTPLPPSETSVKHRPVLITTPTMIDRARDGVAGQTEPFHRSWEAVLARAEGALHTDPTPYYGPAPGQIYWIGRENAWNARALALAFQITGEAKYAERAWEFLAAWAAAAIPDVAANGPQGAGLNLGRILPGFGDTYALIWDELGTSERQTVVDWFQMMIEPVMKSRRIWESGSVNGIQPPYLGRQYFNNHLSGQALAMAAIGFTIRDPRLVQYTLTSPQNARNAWTLIDGSILMPDDIGSGGEGDLCHMDPTLESGAPMPEAGEMMDRYRMRDPRRLAGLPYSLLHLQFLTLISELAHNNRQGQDLFQYVGPNGENIRLPYEYYADYLITGDSSIKSGYYTGSDVPMGEVALYQVAFRHYPDSAKIREVLANVDRVGVPDAEFFNLFAGLTHGTDLSGA